MNKKNKSYFLMTLLITLIKGIEYIILLGTRSNGKSYAAKEYCLTEFIKHGTRFVYVRRYQMDVTNYKMESWMGDMPISTITKGQWTTIKCLKEQFFFAKWSEDGKKLITSKEPIGYCMSVQGDEHYKSLTYPNVGTFVFEEFITRNYYLPDEPTRLMSLISTVARNHKIKVICIGNTISRICPYFTEWSLTGIKKQKPGTLDTYSMPIPDSDEVVKIGVYNCDNQMGSGMFWGELSKSISGTAWECEIQPHLPKPVECYRVLYELVVKKDDNLFLLQLLSDYKQAQNVTWYVQPKTTPIQKGTRVITDDFAIDPKWTLGFRPITVNEMKVFDLIKNGKICYSDNLTGTEFKQVIQMIDGGIL